MATVWHIPVSMAPLASPTRVSVLVPPPEQSMKKLGRIPRSHMTVLEVVESPR